MCVQYKKSNGYQSNGSNEHSSRFRAAAAAVSVLPPPAKLTSAHLEWTAPCSAAFQVEGSLLCSTRSPEPWCSASTVQGNSQKHGDIRAPQVALTTGGCDFRQVTQPAFSPLEVLPDYRKWSFHSPYPQLLGVSAWVTTINFQEPSLSQVSGLSPRCSSSLLQTTHCPVLLTPDP